MVKFCDECGSVITPSICNGRKFLRCKCQKDYLSKNFNLELDDTKQKKIKIIINDEIEFEMMKFEVEGVEYIEKLPEKIPKGINKNTSDSMIKKYNFNLYDDLKKVGKFKCKANSLRIAKRKLENGICEKFYHMKIIAEKEEKNKDKEIFDFNFRGKKYKDYKELDNRLIQEAYFSNSRKRCPKCRFTRIRYRENLKNSICERCGTEFSNGKIIIERERLACQNCLTVNKVRYRISTNDYYCNRCQMIVKRILNLDKKSLLNRYLEFNKIKWENRSQKKYQG